MPKHRTHLPRPTPAEVFEEALVGCKDPRVDLMLRLGEGEGLRRGEIARLHTKQVVKRGKDWWLEVDGKGGKMRVVPLRADLAQAILAHGHGYVFPGNDDGHLSAAWVGKMMSRALGPGPWTAHTLRHSLGTRLYEATGDLYIVKEVLGHSSVDTTTVYARLTDQRLVAGFSKLGGPQNRASTT